MHYKLNVNCGACNLQFFIKDLTLKGSRCPMLLQCGHSVCESCIQQNLKATKVITCQICGSLSPAESQEQISQCFPFNIYLIGSLVTLQNSKSVKNKELEAFLSNKCGNINYAVKDQGNQSANSDSNSSACEECSLPAHWHCENCESNFCEICWSKVHGAARSLMKHCKSSINKTGSIKSGWKKCLEHETQDLEFFCKGCLTTICSHCIIFYHQGEGHCPVTLKDKNVEIINDVKSAAEEAEKISKRMMHTLEKVKHTQNSSGTTERPFSDLENQIRRNFSWIHGILQLEEERLLKKLQKKSMERDNHIQALRLQLENQIKNVEHLLRNCQLAVSRPDGFDLMDLYRELEEVQNLPCYLISQNSCVEKANVAFDDRMIELLRNYCTIDLPSNETFELRSSSDLPEGYAVEPLNLSDIEQSLMPKKGPESSLSDFDSLSNCSSKDFARPDLELLPSKAQKPFIERKNYSVRVSYIKNPGEFYVTLNSQRHRQQAIDRRASQFASCSSNIPETIAKDEIYLVKYNVDKKWYRARVTEVFPPKKIGDEECVKVYYLDYGNTETVPVSRLRHIPPDMLEPPLAVKCKLFDCVPKNGQWCLESAKTMEKILNNCTATMFVMKVHQHCLEVDLSVIYPDGQIGRDILSVRDALLFLEFSSFVHGCKTPRNSTALKYPHQSLPSAGDTFDVIITHVNSPSDFFIQRTRQDNSFMYKLSSDLQKYYSESSEEGVVYNPTVGMPCAAIFSLDKRWYRAKIVDVPGKKMVTVFYVDYGNKETIPWTAIRKLKECFLRRPPMALNCALNGVLPMGENWTAQANSYMENLTLMSDCRVHIHGRPKYKQKLKVLLYKKEVCVNNVFTDLGYAVKANPSRLWKLKDREEEDPSEVFKLSKPYQEIGEDGEDETTSCTETHPSIRNRSYKDRSRIKLSAQKLRELHEWEKRNREAIAIEDTEEDAEEYSNIFRVKVDILSAESPSCIYVTFPALMEEFKQLQEKMNEFYQCSTPIATDWAVGSVCVVFDSTRSSWFRASIVSVLPNDRAEVFLKDVARVTSEPLSALRKLDPSFAKYATCAVKCHLADIGPPGEPWPSISSEFLVNELDNFKEIYMTKKGQIENKSLPVELWVQKIVPRGALEPSAKEWVTLNRLMVDQGLAVPLKQKLLYFGGASNDGESDDFKEPENKKTARAEAPPDSKDVRVASTAFVPSCWPPPKPLTKSCFIGFPTYVDINARIYMYDFEQDDENLKVICDSLLEEYENSKPNLEDELLGPGQMCIARYHADNAWYRGVITQTNEDSTYEVLFVDYGNVENCEASDLRKEIKLHGIPIISHKFQLQGISPPNGSSEWPVWVIDLLHSFVVDKKCQVSVLRPSSNPSDPHTISMKLIEEDIDVATFLISKGLASSTCSTGCSLPAPNLLPLPPVKTDWDADALCYIPLEFPDNCGGFSVRVTSVISETEFFANINDDEFLCSNLKTVLNDFESLQRKLAEECRSQPLLKNFTEGQPCCCMRLGNNMWSRAEIEGSEKMANFVSVFYVDHGEKESISKDLLHQVKSEWLNFPKMSVRFRLANVNKNPSVSNSVYMKALTNCLTRGFLFAEVSNKVGNFLEVTLMSKRNGPLAYQEMIDKDLMTFI